MKPKFDGRDAFTLMELLVVVGVIGLLAALLLPALNKARVQAGVMRCNSNLRQVYFAMEMYADDNDDYYPRAIGVGVWGSTNAMQIGWLEAIHPYAKSRGVYRCPRQPVSLENDFSYFLGSRAAFVSSGGFAAFTRKTLSLPDQYILGGDNTYRFTALSDTDKDNYTQDCLFNGDDNVPIAEYHLGRVNILFGDGHLRAYEDFLPTEMTYAYDRSGINFDGF